MIIALLFLIAFSILFPDAMRWIVSLIIAGVFGFFLFAIFVG